MELLLRMQLLIIGSKNKTNVHGGGKNLWSLEQLFFCHYSFFLIIKWQVPISLNEFWWFRCFLNQNYLRSMVIVVLFILDFLLNCMLKMHCTTNLQYEIFVSLSISSYLLLLLSLTWGATWNKTNNHKNTLIKNAVQLVYTSYLQLISVKFISK